MHFMNFLYNHNFTPCLNVYNKCIYKTKGVIKQKIHLNCVLNYLKEYISQKKNEIHISFKLMWKSIVESFRYYFAKKDV